jgi:hypothetical protein
MDNVPHQAAVFSVLRRLFENVISVRLHCIACYVPSILLNESSLL